MSTRGRLLSIGLTAFLILGLLLTAYAPAGESTTEPIYDDIISCLEDAVKDVNDGQVYLNNNKFEEARQCNVDAQIHLSDAEALLGMAGLSDIEEENIGLAVSGWSETLIALNNMIDVLEIIKTEDWLTWGPYHKIIESLMEAQNKLTGVKEILSDITDPELTEGFNELSWWLTTVDESLTQLQTEEMLNAIWVYTYIAKINTESVRDLAIEVTRPVVGNEEEVTEIFNYVRDNIKYVKDPRFTELNFDYIQSPSQTIERAAGDCDDHAVLLASLLEAVGYSTKLCFVDTDEEEPLEPNHMNVIVTIDDTEYILEATCKTCKMGEYPGEMYYEGYDYAEFKAMMLEAMGEGLAPAAPLNIYSIEFCSEMPQGNRDYSVQPNATYQMSDTIYYYCEVSGATSKRVENGYEIWIKITEFRLFNPEDTMIMNVSEWGEVHETLDHVSEYIWFRFWIQLRAGRLPGQYRIEMVATDMLSGRKGTQTAYFIRQM